MYVTLSFSYSIEYYEIGLKKSFDVHRQMITRIFAVAWKFVLQSGKFPSVLFWAQLFDLFMINVSQTDFYIY